VAVSRDLQAASQASPSWLCGRSAIVLATPHTYLPISWLTRRSKWQYEFAKGVIISQNDLSACQLLLAVKLDCQFNLMKIPRLIGIGGPLTTSDVEEVALGVAQKHLHSAPGFRAGGRATTTNQNDSMDRTTWLN
jgi:hypothetical protein